MNLRLLNWKSLLLNVSAGTFLCLSIGCQNTRVERGGPNLNAPVKTMGPGNQVQNPPSSPAYNNLAGNGPANSFPGTSSNSSAVGGRNNMGPSMQGIQAPIANNGMSNPPAFGQSNMPANNLVIPQNNQPGPVANTYPQPNGVQMMPQQQMPVNYPPPQQQVPVGYPPPQQQMPVGYPPPQQQMPINYQQPQYPQGPAMPAPGNGMPTSMQGLRIPDALPTTAREAVERSGPSLMQASHNVPSPSLDPLPSAPKDQSPKVIAEFTPTKKPSEAPLVTVTPMPEIKEPPLMAPISLPELK